MVLVSSLLVDQLSGLSLTFFGRPKKICSVSGNFWSVSEFFLVKLWFFGILKRNFGIPKRNLVDQKNQSLTKNSLRLNKFFFGRPKKGRNRLDNWSTKRLTKTTWTGLVSSFVAFLKYLNFTTWQPPYHQLLQGLKYESKEKKYFMNFKTTIFYLKVTKIWLL